MYTLAKESSEGTRRGVLVISGTLQHDRCTINAGKSFSADRSTSDARGEEAKRQTDPGRGQGALCTLQCQSLAPHHATLPSRPLPRASSDPPPMATATGAMAATSRAPIPAAAAFPGDLGLGRRQAAAPGWRAGGRRLRASPSARRPFVFSPRGVSDSRSSQTCLDPDASTVRDQKCDLGSWNSSFRVDRVIPPILFLTF